MNEPIEAAQEITDKVTAKDLLGILRGSASAALNGEMNPMRESYSDSFVFRLTAKFKAIKSKISTEKVLQVPGYVGNGYTSKIEARTRFHASRIGEGSLMWDPSSPRGTYSAFGEVYRPLKGYWWLYGVTDRLIDILEALPRNAEIGFYVYLDGGSTELHAQTTITTARETFTGLHTDLLYVVASVTKNGRSRERRFLLDVRTGGHNSARFGYGNS